MNYIRLYNSIIVNAKFREKPDCYCEKHHIVPKCLGGTNEESNLVILTAREHFIVHHLLYKIYPNNNKIFFALSAMNMVKRWNNSSVERYKPKLTSKQYEQLRIKRSIFVSKFFKGKQKSKEHCKHISEAVKRNPRKLTEEQRKNLSNSLKKVVHTPEWNKKVSDGVKKFYEKPRSPEHCKAISISKKGKHIKYNMKSAGFHGTQAGVNNYQATKCYVNGILIGCKKDLVNYIKEKYGFNIDKQRIKDPIDCIKNNQNNLITDKFEYVLLKCLNEHVQMKHREIILSNISTENINKFIKENNIIYLKV